MLKKKYSKSKPTCKVTFALPKEAIQEAIEVKLVGEFNNWNPALGVPMKQTEDKFQAVVELTTGKDYQFRYLADNGIWENDWAADGYVETPYGVCNSVVALSEVAEVVASTATAKKAAKSKAKSKTKAKAKSDTKAATTTAAKKKTKVAAKAAKKTADDLKKIEGIGPKIATLLNEGGIYTFADLSKSNQATLKGILEAAGSRYKMHNPATWPNQAYLAAKGDWAKLNKLQAELSGGKKK